MFYACLFIWNCLYFIHELQFYTSRFRIRRILFGWTWTVHITSWARECWQTIYCWNFDHSWLGDWCRMVFTFIVHFSKLAIRSNHEFRLGFAMFTYLLFFHSRISKESFPNISDCQSLIGCIYWLQWIFENNYKMALEAGQKERSDWGLAMDGKNKSTINWWENVGQSWTAGSASLNTGFQIESILVITRLQILSVHTLLNKSV